MIKDPINKIEKHLSYKIFQELRKDNVYEDYSVMKKVFLGKMKDLVISEYDEIHLSFVFSEILIYDLMKKDD